MYRLTVIDYSDRFTTTSSFLVRGELQAHFEAELLRARGCIVTVDRV